MGDPLTVDPPAPSIPVVAAHRAKEPRALRLIIALGVAAIVGVVVLFVLFLIQRAQSAALTGQITALNGALVTVEHGQQEAAAKSQALAEQVRGLGQTPVVAPASPVQGPPGPAGVAGRGVAGTSIAAGHLIVTYSDGSTVDVGQVVGAPGQAGAAGVSVSSALLVAGHLVVTYTNGTTADVGQVVGPAGPAGVAGRSVVSASDTGGHLIIAYSDGTTSDAGPLPVAPAGRPPASFTFTDELGQRYSCTPDTPADPGASPHYTCTSMPAPTAAAAVLPGKGH